MKQFILFNLLFTFAFFHAKNTYSQHELSLKDALNYAMENSQLIKQAQLKVESGEALVDQSLSAAMPQIDLNSSITGNPIVQQFVLPAAFMGGAEGDFVAIRAGQNWGAQTQVTLSQQIFNQSVFSGLKAARESKSYYEMEAQLSEDQVLNQVATTYYNLLVVKAKMATLDANLKRIEELETITTGLFNNDLARQIDVDRLTVNKSNILAQKTSLESSIKQLEYLLKYYIGMPLETDISVSSEAVQELEDYGHSIAIADSLNSDELLTMRLMKKKAELLKLQTKVHRAGYFPTLYISGHYTYLSQSNDFNLYSKKALNYDMAAISLNLSIPIFDGLARKAKISESKIQLKQLEQEIEKTESAVDMAYRNAQLKIKNNLEIIQSQYDNKELARKVYDITHKNYKLGLASLTDVINAETELRTAENTYVDALLQLKVAELELIQAKGEIKTLLN